MHGSTIFAHLLVRSIYVSYSINVLHNFLSAPSGSSGANGRQDDEMRSEEDPPFRVLIENITLTSGSTFFREYCYRQGRADVI